MNKKIHKIVSLFLVILIFFAFSQAGFAYNGTKAAKTQKHILIIYALSPDYPGSMLYSEGIKSVLNENKEYQFIYSYEYLNAKRFENDENYYNLVSEFLEEKYSKNEPDIVITANSPMISNYDEMFPDAPVVLAWNDNRISEETFPSNYTLITKEDNIEKSVEFILKSKPDTKAIYFICDKSSGGSSLIEDAKNMRKKYLGKVDFIFTDTKTKEEMIFGAANLDENSAILFHHWFFDANNIMSIPEEVLAEVIKKTDLPVYVTGHQFLGYGAVGGYMYSSKYVGKTAGHAVLDILYEKNIKTQASLKMASSEYFVDWRVIKEKGIHEDNLPEGTIIEHKELGIWEKYWGYVLGAIILMILQTVLILALLIIKKRQRKTKNELIEANFSLKEMANKLLEYDKSKDEFLVNTSHEIQTPLNAIINISETMATDGLGELSQKQKEEINVITSVSKRLSSLIKDIIDIEKIKRNEMNFNYSNVDVKSVIYMVTDVFRSLNTNKDVEILNNVPENISDVFTDENRLVQVFFNLISNAIKFTDRGTIIISASEEDDFVNVLVEDSGSGIPKNVREKLFKSNISGNIEHLNSKGGSGLGLNISHKLLEKMGAEISVLWSEPNTGTCFSLRIPRSRTEIKKITHTVVEEIQNNIVKEKEKTAMVTKLPYRILAVDDEPTNLRVLKMILGNEGYEVITASDGLEAIEILKREPNIDLALMDVMMPHISGYETCKIIRESYTIFELPILILTVRSSLDDIEAGYKAGANDFIVKPFVAKELVARVATYFQMKKSVQESLKNEMAFLQAQIKPHFLYNTMSTIMSFCYTDGEKAAELLGHLSEYLQKSYSIDNTVDTVILENEIMLTKAYTHIEKARFGDRLNVEYYIDENLGKQQILPLTIQPIVENAIRHGLMSKRSGGTVKIIIKKELEKIRIQIEDNGIGIENVEDIFVRDKSKIKSNSGVGLINIKRRLMKHYSTELVIKSKKCEGTTIFFEIPINNEKR